MHSTVNWALLGLVIERPSYGYELAQRFERTYGDALPLSSHSHAYAALRVLEERGLIEEAPGSGRRSGRQPKPDYRATAAGVIAYDEWLRGQVAEDRRRHNIFLLQITALAKDPERAMTILDEYEKACLNESATNAIARDPAGRDLGRSLQARLIAEEKRLAAGARVAWARFARSQIKTQAQERSRPQAGGQPPSAPGRPAQSP